MHRLLCFAAAASILAAPAAWAAAAQPAAKAPAVLDLPAHTVDRDSEATVNGVEVACTGVADTRADPKWAAFPVRVEFSGAQNEYMIDAVVALVNAKGKPVAVIRCEGPWLLLKPAPGEYSVFAKLVDSSAKPRSARFTTPKHGQQRVVLQFPDA